MSIYDDENSGPTLLDYLRVAAVVVPLLLGAAYALSLPFIWLAAR